MLANKVRLIFILTIITCVGCQDKPLNDPYPQFSSKDNTLYSAFSERPKHLDPAISYSADEATFTYQIYEPLFQYHYLKRPFQLIPLTAVGMPIIRYVDNHGAEVGENNENIIHSVYRLQIKPNIYYQQHPAFATFPDSKEFRYYPLQEEDVVGKHTLYDFAYQSTRELVAEDYVYEIKRLASPRVNSPIYGVMEEYIVGFKAFSDLVKKQDPSKEFIDLRDLPMEGLKVIDRYTFEITLVGKYPQFLQWLAMPFFAPVPWEADQFYSQKVLQKRNITLDWFPVGTGPYILAENNPNLQMVLEKNPHFHGETYPMEGAPGDEEAGLLKNKGKALPFIERVVFMLEKEDIPYWTKFLQGYYDQSGISTNNFDQALKSMSNDSIELSDELKAKGITLTKTIVPTVFYWGFNMLDSTVGGYSEKNKKLRRALAIAFDMEEYVSIFANGRGEAAQSPIPEGIFGYQNDAQGTNPFVYNINPKSKTQKRRDILEAKKLLSEAGFPRGINPKTKQPLTLALDVPGGTGPDYGAQLAWFRKQFEKLGIELVINATQYSRFQDKMQNGDFQLYALGWNADYPDPENFFFLFDSENGKVKFGGMNTGNYSNSQFDALYRKMKMMPDSPDRLKIIQQLKEILWSDMPWMAAYFPSTLTLKQQWVGPSKPNPIARNTIKYLTVEPLLREQCQLAWNKAQWWPVIVTLILLIICCLPAVQLYIKKTRRPLVLHERQEKTC